MIYFICKNFIHFFAVICILLIASITAAIVLNPLFLFLSATLTIVLAVLCVVKRASIYFRVQ